MTSPLDHRRLHTSARTDGPRRGTVRTWLATAAEFVYDARRFVAHSAAVSARRLASLRALVTMDTHRVEKGLVVAAPKAWFGRSIVERLTVNTTNYLDAAGDTDVCRAAIDAISEYLASNETEHDPAPEWARELKATLGSLAARVDAYGEHGGTMVVSREAIHEQGKLNSLEFFHSRHSARQFTGEAVEWEKIESAVAAAQCTPSVCNRQSWSVHAFERGEAANAVLACQNGNAGFGHTASHVLLVAVDLRAFVYLGERNQGWVDGGMFAMSLIHAFHALGIGACCLNWSVDGRVDRRLRGVADIPDWENVVMMLAIGHLPESLAVARSWRRPVHEVVRPGALRVTGANGRAEVSARVANRQEGGPW